MTAKGKIRIAALVAATIAGGPALAGDPPGRHCGMQMLRGLYLFTGAGFNPVNGTAVPKTIVESIRFNGDGTLVAETATITVLGQAPVRSAGALGTYTVEPNCTGTISFSNGPTFDTFVSSPLLLTLTQTGPAPAVLLGDARFISR